MSRIKVTPVAESVPFDNESNGFNSDNVQSAIEEAANTGSEVDFIQFQKLGNINFDQYLYSYRQAGNSGQRSGDASNGYHFVTAEPVLCPFGGTITDVIFAIKGIAQSTGSAAANVNVNFEVWSVGFQNEGSKLGDIDISVSSGSFTIGNWWDSSIDTNFKGSEQYDISVSQGDLLAVKFIRVTGSSNAVALYSPTLRMRVEKT